MLVSYYRVVPIVETIWRCQEQQEQFTKDCLNIKRNIFRVGRLKLVTMA